MQPLALSLFDYALAPERIAQNPANPRDASRLLVLPRASGPESHRVFSELPGLLVPGDLLVVNRTRVIPARLLARRAGGGRAEILFVRPLDGSLQSARRWQALGNPAKGFRPGKVLSGPEGLTVQVVGRERGLVELLADRPVWPLLEAHGQVPLPPYIERGDKADSRDVGDYQTLFARESGAVAAPTASLHFTQRVLDGLGQRGVERAEVVLHVGPGTFLPVRDDHAEDVRGHPMHAEWYRIPPESAEMIRTTRRRGGRIIAVGTTAVRALESWAATCRSEGETTLFIYPGYRFRAVDGMLTNFHLPRSTLLMLVSAFAGRQRVLDAYAEAIRQEYRFFSYGDAMLMV